MSRRLLLAAALAAMAGQACVRNPVTGSLELSLISESQEIRMGREYDPQIVAYEADARRVVTVERRTTLADQWIVGRPLL